MSKTRLSLQSLTFFVSKRNPSHHGFIEAEAPIDLLDALCGRGEEGIDSIDLQSGILVAGMQDPSCLSLLQYSPV